MLRRFLLALAVLAVSSGGLALADDIFSMM